jgi:sRNA-binding carbon storage regulator CsrA
MLVLSRKIGESVLISPLDNLDPAMTVKELFSKGPITITIRSIARQVRIGFDAPQNLRILRDELVKLIQPSTSHDERSDG